MIALIFYYVLGPRVFWFAYRCKWAFNECKTRAQILEASAYSRKISIIERARRWGADWEEPVCKDVRSKVRIYLYLLPPLFLFFSSLLDLPIEKERRREGNFYPASNGPAQLYPIIFPLSRSLCFFLPRNLGCIHNSGARISWERRARSWNVNPDHAVIFSSSSCITAALSRANNSKQVSPGIMLQFEDR